MPLLFSYGTLQQEGVQLSTFGRLLKGEPDALVGYDQTMVKIDDADVVAKSGKTHHPIVAYSGASADRVAGTVFEITDAELAAADAYEVDAYKRVLAPLASGRSAWVYVDARGAETSDRDLAPAVTDCARAAGEREWVAEAVQRIEADFARSADTHLIKLELPRLAAAGVDLYLKDESTHPSGSLKHRLARSLFLYGLCNGWIGPGRPVVECSSGSTAISEAYFARLIGVPFVAVAPRGTAQPKLDAIAFFGGETRLVAPADIHAEAQRIADASGGHFMDQFTYAERATDWRGNNNIADSLFSQMRFERFATPAWVVVSAGTGGTSSTIGRYIRYRQRGADKSRLCVVDPDNSAFFDAYRVGDRDLRIDRASRIEGIGRPRVEASFIMSVVDRMMHVSDAASIATIHWLETVLGRKCGGSTGTNLYGALRLAEEMIAAGSSGSIVTLICDPGERYLATYYDAGWIAAQGLDLSPHRDWLDRFDAA